MTSLVDETYLNCSSLFGHVTYTYVSRFSLITTQDYDMRRKNNFHNIIYELFYHVLFFQALHTETHDGELIVTIVNREYLDNYS